MSCRKAEDMNGVSSSKPTIATKQDFENIEKLPDYGELKREVKRIKESSTWWERHGVDWSIIGFSACVLFPLALRLLQFGGFGNYILAVLLLGFVHSTVANKGGHLAAHGGLTTSRRWSMFWSFIFVETYGFFSLEKAYEIHIRIHHPHTNVIGLGDSSSWKAPSLGRYMYMFCAPLTVPLLTPIVSIQKMWGEWNKVFKFCVNMAIGKSVLLFIFVKVAGLSFPAAMFTLYASRSVVAIPYIHVNIFQHIGLPMYSKETRPGRLQLMSTGCLNLSRNIVLDYCFGHSLISCHVEHHLFPELSDNMCLNVKPVVRAYLQKHHLPYKEDTYMNRLRLFVEKYQELMVDPPPISKFVGLQ